MKSLLVCTGRYLYKVYNYHDSRACGYMQSLILSRLDGFGVEWFWFSLCGSHVFLCAPWWIVLCDIL
jgi:hypothetical protein